MNGADTPVPFKGAEEIPECVIYNIGGDGGYLFRGGPFGEHSNGGVNNSLFQAVWNGGNGWHYYFKQKVRIVFASRFSGSDVSGNRIVNANADFWCYDGVIVVLELL